MAYVEKDEYCREVISARIQQGIFSQGEVYGDIAEFNKSHAHKYRDKIDVLTGGFPCQPFSVAGKQKGTSDERYLFDEIIKTIKIVRPKRIFFENVRGLLSSNAIIEIFAELKKRGYNCKPPLLLGSDDCGNVHQRKRLWIYGEVANTASERCDLGGCENTKRSQKTRTEWQSNNVAKQTDTRSIQRRDQIKKYVDYFSRPDVPSPIFLRMDDELASGRKRLKAIGNGQDPVVMATAYLILSGEYEKFLTKG